MRKVEKSVLAVSVAAFAVACADPTSPAVSRALESDVALAVTKQVVGTNMPAEVGYGNVRLCKSVPPGDPGATFTFTVTVTKEVGAGALDPVLVPAPSLVVPAGGQSCVNVYHSTQDNTGLDKVVIVENAPPSGWALTDIDIEQLQWSLTLLPPNPGLLDNFVVATRTATAYVNDDMGRRVTFENDFTPTPSTGCTYTKGWYQNKNGAPTVIAVDGRTKAEAQAIFAATPGKPNGVTWGSNNLLLNLYQQLLAALNNLGGDANEDNGPTAVDDAIDAAQDGTNGSGLNITTTLTQTQMSALVLTLSQFNEGTFAGWPHCDD